MLRRILVADQNANNTLKLYKAESPCCGDGGTLCEYSLTFTQATGVTSITVEEDGANVAIALSPATTSAADVLAELKTKLYAAGYEEDNEGAAGIVVTDLGSTLSVVITGDIIPVSVASGGTVTFTAACTQILLCTYSLTGYAGGTTGTSATTLKVNGVSYDIGTVTAGTTTSGDVDTAITADLTTSGITFSGVTVTTTGSGGSQTYNITITGADSTATIVLADAYFTRSDCAEDWI
jgi:hypothetical protein